jgi:hypothetical protein
MRRIFSCASGGATNNASHFWLRGGLGVWVCATQRIFEHFSTPASVVRGLANSPKECCVCAAGAMQSIWCAFDKGAVSSLARRANQETGVHTHCRSFHPGGLSRSFTI